MEKKLTSQSFLKAEAQKSMQKILDSKEGKEFFSEPYQHIVIENFFDGVEGKIKEFSFTKS